MGPYGGCGTGLGNPRPSMRYNVNPTSHDKRQVGVSHARASIGVGKGGRKWLTRLSTIIVSGSSSRPFEQHQNCSINCMQRSILVPTFFFANKNLAVCLFLLFLFWKEWGRLEKKEKTPMWLDKRQKKEIQNSRLHFGRKIPKRRNGIASRENTLTKPTRHNHIGGLDRYW